MGVETRLSLLLLQIFMFFSSISQNIIYMGFKENEQRKEHCLMDNTQGYQVYVATDSRLMSLKF